MHPLEKFRKDNKLKMLDMGTLLQCSISVYKSWIYGWRYPSPKNLMLIETKTGVTPGALWEAYKDRQPEAAE